nr:hypothetical protein [uncultured Fluviicola sp.]
MNIDELQKIFHAVDGCQIRSNASGIIQLGDFIIVLQGIKCYSNGNYAFDDDSKFDRINLIEINVPQGAESTYEIEIRQIANEISDIIGWQIDWKE